MSFHQSQVTKQSRDLRKVTWQGNCVLDMQQMSLKAPVKFYMYKFCDHTTHLTKFWSNLTLTCYANTCQSWRTNRRRVPTDYILSARVFWPNARNWVVRKLRRIQFALQEEQLYAECGVRLKKFHPSNLLCISPSLFATNINKAKK